MIDPPKAKKKNAEPRRIKSIEVGFRILRVLQEAEGKMSLRDIASRVNMHASNVYLYLASFVYEGVAEQDPATSHYGLGPAAIQLGAAALRQSSLIDLAKGELAALREETRNSVMLSVWGNRGPTIVFKIDGDAYGVLGIRVGHVLPLLTSTTGRVFLTFIPEEQWKGLVEIERSANITLGGSMNGQVGDIAIPDIVAPVKSQGLSCMDGEINGRYPSCAAPIFDQAGQLCAVVTMLINHAGAPDAGTMRGMNEKLLSTTRALSRKLGHLAGY